MAMISYDNCGHVVDGTHLCARCCAGQQIVAYPHNEALQEPHSQHNTTQHNNSTTIQLTTNSIADLVYNRRSFVTATTQLKSTQLVHSAGHLSNCFIITHRKAFLFFFFFFTLLYTIFFFAFCISFFLQPLHFRKRQNKCSNQLLRGKRSTALKVKVTANDTKDYQFVYFGFRRFAKNR